MNWREWVYNKLKTSIPFVAIVPVASIYGSGSLTGAPSDKPFVVITFGVETVELRDGDNPAATSQYMTLYFHDEPGDFGRIDSAVILARSALQGQTSGVDGGICATWQGDSQDLADDHYGTIMRNSEYRLIGRKAV